MTMSCFACGKPESRHVRRIVEPGGQVVCHWTVNHYRRLMAGFDRQHAESVALFDTALAEGAQLIEHTLRRIGRQRESDAQPVQISNDSSMPGHNIFDALRDAGASSVREIAPASKRDVSVPGAT